MPRHLAVGNINVDLYVYVERLPEPDEELPVERFRIAPGGAAANYAVGASLAGHEAHLLAHTAKHAESFGVLSALRERGVVLDKLVVHEEGLPGIVVVVVTRGGETVMFKVRGVNELLRGDEVKGEKFDVIHVASVEPSVALRVLDNNTASITSYDPGGAVAFRMPSRVASMAGRVTILTLNAREFVHVFGYSIGRAASTLPDDRYLLLRLGARGSLLVWNKGVLYARSCAFGTAVDTTGAGDAFNAYFNSWLAEGRSVEEALVAGSVAAGLKVLREGAQSIPARGEVEDRMSACADIVRRLSFADAESLVREVA